MDRPERLEPRQEQFCQEYLIDLNATQACIRAGYSKKSAGRFSVELLSKPHIQERIQELKAGRAERVELTQDMIVNELKKLAFANILDYATINQDGDPIIDMSAMTRDQAAALTEATVDTFVDGRGEDAVSVKRIKIKMADKKASLELLGKHIGMWPVRIGLGQDPDAGAVKIEVCYVETNTAEAE